MVNNFNRRLVVTFVINIFSRRCRTISFRETRDTRYINPNTNLMFVIPSIIFNFETLASVKEIKMYLIISLLTSFILRRVGTEIVYYLSF